MTYLLAKFALLFLLASLSGFVLGRWITRRRFVDVSESYEGLREAAGRSDEAQWNRLWSRLDAIPDPKEINLSGISERLDGLAYAVTNLPEPKEPGKVNLEPIATKLDEVDKAVRKMNQQEPRRGPDLQPIRAELSMLREDIQRLSQAARSKLVDVEPVTLQIESLDKRIREASHQATIDLRPIDNRLCVIETSLRALAERLVEPAAASAVPISAARSESATLTAATHGEKDDLRRIRGVGPQLQGVLNEHGIFYFWQIAAWTSRDIREIDEKLSTFKGRIDRDNWVSQARQLSAEPGSARRPAAFQKSA